MKRKSRIFVAAVVMAVLVMALASTAFAAGTPSVVASNANPKPGDTVIFTVTTANDLLTGNVAASSNLTYVGNDGEALGADASLLMAAATTIKYSYTVKADAAPGSAISFTVSGMLGANNGDGGVTEDPIPGTISATGTVAGASAPPVGPTPQGPPSSDSNAVTTTLAGGTVYYDMVNGAPGASHTLSKATTVQVVEKMSNGYTKVLMGTTTYLVKTAAASGGSGLDDVPKTADATGGIWLIAVMGLIAAGGIGLWASKKASSR